MMRALLESVTEPVAALWASEGEIYGRFGYGVATWGQHVRVDRRAAVFHPDAPVGGVVRLVERAEADKVLPEAYERVGLARTGAMSRPAFYWSERRALAQHRNRLRWIAVHRGPDGDDGFVAYYVEEFNDGSAGRTRLNVEDLQAANPAAWAGLWRFLLSVDLVGEVFAESRPADEPVRWLFTNPRACQVADVMDEIWLRLVDVPTALTARSYQDSAPVVIELADALLPANSGRYHISGDGARRTDEPAGLALDASALASLYLGGVRPSALAVTGRLRVLDPAALDAAERLFATDVVPWCGTSF
jgi:predicted acetyltransferase